MIIGEARLEQGLRIYAIGDIHGCLDELHTMISSIDAEQGLYPSVRYKIIFLGDYTDRGPENRKVIDYLLELEASHRECIFLRGNHDEKFLLFLKHPKRTGRDFLKWGGDATLRDYGVMVQPNQPHEDASRMFDAAVPKEHLDFLKRLKPSHVEGDYFFCHAGVRPGVALNEQTEHDLVWIRTDFLFHDEPFEKVIIHGHTIVDEVEVKINRINVDTCCYGTGCLTAVVLEDDSHRFLQT